MKTKKYLPRYRTLIGGLVLCAAFLYFFPVIKVSGNSMVPTIADGDLLLFWNFAYGIKKPLKNAYFVMWNAPHKDDIVLFIINGRPVVKRVALCSGTVLEHYEKDGAYYLLLDNYALKLDAESYRTIFGDGSIKTVPTGYFFALGDNVRLSEDSRHYGFVANTSVLGKVLCK